MEYSVSTLKTNLIQPSTGTAVQIPGHVIQVVQGTANSTPVTVQSTTFTDANCTATITPKFSTSKILITCTQDVQAWNTSSYATARWRIVRNVGGGSFTSIYEDTSSANGNVFFYDYGGSGINCYVPISYTMLDSPNTTSACIYKTQGCQGSNGGNRAVFNQASPSRIVLQEIAQ
tara:strand:+ start:18 stop:542 length:525 start_codon:yes stop_codon:yes gene_type:complete